MQQPVICNSGYAHTITKMTKQKSASAIVYKMKSVMWMCVFAYTSLPLALFWDHWGRWFQSLSRCCLNTSHSSFCVFSSSSSFHSSSSSFWMTHYPLFLSAPQQNSPLCLDWKVHSRGYKTFKLQAEAQDLHISNIVSWRLVPRKSID